MLSRRGFVAALGACFVGGPAIVRAGGLMPVKSNPLITGAFDPKRWCDELPPRRIIVSGLGPDGKTVHEILDWPYGEVRPMLYTGENSVHVVHSIHVENAYDGSSQTLFPRTIFRRFPEA